MNKDNTVCRIQERRGSTVEVCLIRGGRLAYLWIGSDGQCIGIVTGQASLRKLALAILKEVPAPKKKARKKR